MPSDSTIYVIIAGAFFGFIALAFVLLYPVYRFMRRQEEIADDWTVDALTRRQREAGGDGAPPEDRASRPRPPADAD